jgi:hypothetical protein
MSLLHILASANDAALQTPDQRVLATELAERILEKGDIRVNSADYKGMFPLDHAVANQASDGGAMAILFKRYGATLSKAPSPIRSPPSARSPQPAVRSKESNNARLPEGGRRHKPHRSKKKTAQNSTDADARKQRRPHKPRSKSDKSRSSNGDTPAPNGGDTPTASGVGGRETGQSRSKDRKDSGASVDSPSKGKKKRAAVAPT